MCPPPTEVCKSTVIIDWTEMTDVPSTHEHGIPAACFVKLCSSEVRSLNGTKIMSAALPVYTLMYKQVYSARLRT